MSSPAEDFPAIREALTEHYGRLGSPFAGLDVFEAFVSAMLDRAFEPKSRDAAVSAFRDEGLLDPQTLSEADPSELDEALRSAGLKVPKGALGPLRGLARWLIAVHHGDLASLVGEDSRVATSQLRDELLNVNGVGPATADSLLVFALNRPTYPVDRASYRVFLRHGWIDLDAGYDDAREAIERVAPDDSATLAGFSIAMERIGKDFCRASVPKCERCPLRPFLPEGGPISPDLE